MSCFHIYIYFCNNRASTHYSGEGILEQLGGNQIHF